MMKLSDVEIARRVKETDRLAILMCEECGLDPYQSITCRIGDDVTPYEYGTAAYPHHDTGPIRLSIMSQTYEVAQHRYDTTTVQQWRLFRRHAFQAIAYQRAFERYMLTEA